MQERQDRQDCTWCKKKCIKLKLYFIISALDLRFVQFLAISVKPGKTQKIFYINSLHEVLEKDIDWH